ncbi:MAG: YgfZ/GcvT domain-containing protein [Rubricella sp.]
MKAWTDSDRALLRLTGTDVRDFLQGLVTNDVRRLDDGPVYAAILTPQGKYLADFILVPDGDGVLIDVAADQAASLQQRLTLYKLRADVAIAPDDRSVTLVWGGADLPGHPDPRNPALGTRLYGAPAPADAEEATAEDWHALRVALGVPQAGSDLIANDSFILEMGFERLNGVDFRKGCYVGQEVTARMKHKTELKKGLVRVRIEGAAAPGTEILAEDGRVAGDLRSVAGQDGLAYLRFDRADGPLRAGEATIRLADQP